MSHLPQYLPCDKNTHLIVDKNIKLERLGEKRCHGQSSQKDSVGKASV